MTPLRVEICNERLLPRFGVDRFLVLLGQGLAQAGYQVSFACLRRDPALLAPITKDVAVLEVPAGLDMAATEGAVMSLMARRWQQRRPHVLVSGGWPFFETAARAESLGVKSIFIDAGAVAQNGLPESLLPIQQELRRIRQLTLPAISRVLPISEFIRASQTELERGGSAGVRTVLLGTDHLVLPGCAGAQHADQKLLARLDDLTAQGAKLMLLLGRFEPVGYKNSRAAYELLRLLGKNRPQARLLILDDAGADCRVPPDLAAVVIPLGAPTDATLQEVMRRCSLGLSMSLWEGFNLPLAEMQWLDRPALAFNVAAHPEVVADPWLLCDNLDEMAAKAEQLLRGDFPLDLQPRFAAFRERLQWATTLAAWEDEIASLANGPATTSTVQTTPSTRRIVLADVSNSARDPANPGVIRVTRRLCSALQQYPGLELVFAVWDREREHYAFLNPRQQKFLETFGGPTDGLGLLAGARPDGSVTDLIRALSNQLSRPPVLLLPEVMLDSQTAARMQWARTLGCKLAVILYDLIPYYHGEFCGSTVRDAFPAYLEAVVQADALWSISQSTLQDFRRYIAESGYEMPAVHEAVLLPGQFGEQSRNNGGPLTNAQAISILCVSTLEPRKNHLRLLQAFQMLRQRRPELPLRLVLIGNRYAGAPEIAEHIELASKADPSIQWHGIADDALLTTEFRRATFTVYPSLVEGFGLPILESLWMGRPCLTHNTGVMSELAAGGGCMTVDMTDINAIASSLEQLATSEELAGRLRQETQLRHISTWQEYASDIAERILKL